MAIASLTSNIDSVKVYAAGATITRVAHLQLNAGEMPEHVEIAGLPLALDDSSVRVRIEAEQGAAAIATDLRIGLSVPPRQQVHESPAEEEVQEAKAEVRRIEDAIALIENEISILSQLDVPKRPEGEQGKAPPPLPITARLALANFKDEQVCDRITQRRETQQKLRKATEHLKDLLAKKARASSAREVRPHELRKTVVVRLSYEGEEITVEGQQLVVEYFVPGTRWTPNYVCRLDSTSNQTTIAVRALICQRTGEDWSGVRLQLSTAEPMAWCELPELPSLRIGRTQPVVRKSGWRLPPIGAEILFEDFDRQKQAALSVLPKQDISTKLGYASEVIEVVRQAVQKSQECNYVDLPPGGINVRQVAGSFDYAYNADGRIDVPSDGEFHCVALTSNSTDVDLRYVVVPRKDTNVFRIAQLKNPLQAPLLSGSADVYVDGEYILSTNITTVPPKGQMELGLGVEQAIKVARNTTYQEVRSSESLVAFNELQHQIKIDIANRLPQEARIEVRERIPIPNENAKVDVQIDRVSPEWEKYDQKERDTPVRGGYCWRVQVPAFEQTTLAAQYTIKTFVDSELMGGNRRE